jgi:hypothetical protein
VRLALELLPDGQRFELPERGTLVVGSAAERAQAVIGGPGVDDAHCAVGRTKDGGLAAKDLGSRAGLFVNGARVEAARLALGDELALGSRRLRVIDLDAPIEGGAAGQAGEAAQRSAATRGSSSDVERAARPADAPRVPPLRIGGFRIERLLGRGAMGEVYLALQESLRRPVALKVLSSELSADLDFVRRFQAEAHAAAALSHPNVVVVHDVGAVDGYHYLAMEYMAGGSLEERVAHSGPLAWRAALDVLADAASGLVYAEEHGIVHRDIKPANLMIAASGVVKIADLGLAMRAGEDAQPEGRRVFGTPHFVSPEQARGEPLDHRSDLYSLGATAYRVLTGRTPFEGASTRDILRAHFQETPRPPSAHVASIPPALDQIVLRLLEKSPADRYANAADLLREVERLRSPAARMVSPKGSRVPLLIAIAALLVLAWVLGWRFLAPEREASSVADGGRQPLDASGGAALSPDDPAFFDLPVPYEAPATAPDEEGSLRMLDLEAQVAYHQIARDAPLAERIAALELLVERFGPSDTAARALREIAELERTLLAEQAESRRLSTEVFAAEQELRKSAGWPPPPGEFPRPGDALRAALGWSPAPALAETQGWRDARARLLSEIVASSLVRLGAELERVRDAIDHGAFDEAQSTLDAVAPLFDLPELAPEIPPAHLEELRLMASEVLATRVRLPALRLEWGERNLRADRAALASVLGPSGGFRAAVARLDLVGAQGLIQPLLASSTDARSWIAELVADVERARAVLRLLGSEFRAGGWKRKLVTDPRGRRNTPREALSVDDEGIVVEKDGASERISWSAFGARTDALAQLFVERLAREYTPSEARSIAALLRLCACSQAAALALDALAPADPNGLSDSQARELEGAFDPAHAWLEGLPGALLAEERALLAREEAAAATLVKALFLCRDGRYGEGVAELELLFSQSAEALLVRLLSDGSDWRSAAAPSSEH